MSAVGAAHPSVRRLLAAPGVEVVCFAQNAKRRWLLVIAPDGRRAVVSAPLRRARVIS